MSYKRMVGNLNDEDSQHFRKFASNLYELLEDRVETNDEERLSQQKILMEELVDLEKKFRELLVVENGVEPYRTFVDMVLSEKKNILHARPFFRERQSNFSLLISETIKNRRYEELACFSINYTFISFMKKRGFCKSPKMRGLINRIQFIRNDLTEVNMPLAISRARIFWSQTPKSQLSYMDLIQMAAEGLVVAVDKYCLPFSSSFRAVIIGRILSNFLKFYNSNMIHFHSKDKRKLYKVNKILRQLMEVCEEETLYSKLADILTSEGLVSTAGELANLVSAASCVSSNVMNSEDNTVLDDHLYEDSQQEFSQDRMKWILDGAIRNHLTPFEQKFIILKGVSF